mgnify:CR=1 FL=1
MSPDLWLIASFLVLLLLGVPVAFALGPVSYTHLRAHET